MSTSYYQETMPGSEVNYLEEKEGSGMNCAVSEMREEKDLYLRERQESGPSMQRGESRSSGQQNSIQDSVLLFCPDPVSRSAMSHFLEMENIKVSETEAGSGVPDSISSDISLFLLDAASSSDLEQFARQLVSRWPEIPIIIMEEPSADTELRKKVSKYAFAAIMKPCDRNVLLQTIRQALRMSRYVRENRCLRQTIGMPILPVSIAGISATIQTLRKQIEAFARLDNTILISGERGTGRSTIAQMIHQTGPRAKYPFLVVSCSALPQDVLEADLFGVARGAIQGISTDRPGRIELAHRGTIFLDHIESLSPSLQKRLFHFLQDRTTSRVGSSELRRVDTRIIASTSSDLAIACVQGRFRDELYFRLNALTLNAPSLRDRTEDIPSLSREILSRLARASHRNLSILSTAALNKLRQYSWPYNIRELESVLEKAMKAAPDTVITENDISFDTMIQDSRSADGAMGLAGLTMAEIERRAIIETINACGGNRAQSARKLGVSEKTIYNKIKQFKLRGIV
ncbi:MAG: sigma-54 dependent transcriptional regulator [Planctomycetia bacterium]|nr:sigma-54 dependent transcriptional regulator [Planctomycetia bacterium]